MTQVNSIRKQTDIWQRYFALGFLASISFLFACNEALPPGATPPPVIQMDAGISSDEDSGAITTRPDTGEPNMDIPDSGVPQNRVANPNASGNAFRDTDCDGLSDEEEFGIRWANAAVTNPNIADSDEDGLLDGLEAGRSTSIDPFCSDFTGDFGPNSRTNPTVADTDLDGLIDGDEDHNLDGVFARLGETDPRNPDTDGDGLCDGPNDVPPICTGGDPEPFFSGMDSDSDGVRDEVDAEPNNPDSDGDGLCDGGNSVVGVCTAGEDINGDGIRSSQETSPQRIDTDCDGLVDGRGYGNFIGELDLGTHPTQPDTDGDGLIDGIEAGITIIPDPSCPGLSPDADPMTTTSATIADTDGDQVPDGAEDSNQNGRVDTDELDPNNPADINTDPTVAQACGLMNLRPLDRPMNFQADLQIASSRIGLDAFSENSAIIDSIGREIGMIAFNPISKVSYLTLKMTPLGATVEDDRILLVDLIDTNVNETSIQGVSWDNYPSEYANFLVSGPQNLKSYTNQVLSRISGANLMGQLTTSMDVLSSEGLAVNVQVSRRSNQTLTAVIAIAPADLVNEFSSSYSETTKLTMQDLTAGAALAQFGDAVGLKCDRFASQAYSKLDILWAIDNSSSMSDEQNVVAAAGSAFVARLNGATVDWRTSAVTSTFYNPRGQNCTNLTCGDSIYNQCRGFTSDLGRFKSWFERPMTLDRNSPPAWLGAGTWCNQAREGVLRSAQMILSDPAISNTPGGQPAFSFLPASATANELQLRSDAELLVIVLGDADDLYFDNIDVAAGTATTAYVDFFSQLPVQRVSFGGIICPTNKNCGEGQRNPRVARSVIRSFGGRIGSLDDRDINNIPSVINAIIDDALSTASPYILTQPAIPSSIKVAIASGSTVGTCSWNDMPRSSTNGFNYNPATRTITFHGDCRPNAAINAARISVSYRYWIDLTENPDGDPCPICSECEGFSVCDEDICECVCPQQMSCGAGLQWDAESCDCVCDTQALNCGPVHEADESLCACVCQDDCGGCSGNEICNQSLCECIPIQL